MPKKWQLQEAKNHFSEVVNDALREGPQVVTRHGEETVMVISVKDYRKLSKPRQSLYEFLKGSPHRDIDLDPGRSKDLPRSVDL